MKKLKAIFRRTKDTSQRVCREAQRKRKTRILTAAHANIALSQIINASNYVYIKKFNNAYQKLMNYSPSWGFWGASDKEYFVGDFTSLLDNCAADADDLVKDFLRTAQLFEPSRSQAAGLRDQATAIYNRVHELLKLVK